MGFINEINKASQDIENAQNNEKSLRLSRASYKDLITKVEEKLQERSMKNINLKLCDILPDVDDKVEVQVEGIEDTRINFREEKKEQPLKASLLDRSKKL